MDRILVGGTRGARQNGRRLAASALFVAALVANLIVPFGRAAGATLAPAMPSLGVLPVCIAVTDQTMPGSPGGLALGADGRLWSTYDNFTPGIVAVDPASNLATSYPQPAYSGLSALRGAAAGPDGKIWFVAPAADSVLRMSTAGVIEELPPLLLGTRPWDVAAGPDGLMYVTFQGTNKIARFDPAAPLAAPVLFTVPSGANPNGSPLLDANLLPIYNLFGITLGSDGNLWFAEAAAHKLGRLTPGGVITEFAVGSATLNAPRYLTSFPAFSPVLPVDGAIWFTETGDSPVVGRILTGAGNIVTTYPIAPAVRAGVATPATPVGIVGAAIDGGVWFADSSGQRIGRLDPVAGAMTFPVDLNIVTQGANPQQIMGLANGAVWFTENAKRIGSFSINRSGTVLNATPPNVTFTPIGTFQDSPRVYSTQSHILIAVATTGACLGATTITFTSADGLTTITRTISGTSPVQIDFPYDATWTITMSVTQDGVLYPQPSIVATVDNTKFGLSAVLPGTPTTPTLVLTSTTPASQSTVTTPIVNGTGAPAGATVSILDGTTLVGSGSAGTSGSFNVTTSTLAVGSHSFTATATGAITSGSLTYTVLAPSTTPTLVLTSTTPASPSTVTTPLVNGTGAPAGATVTILDGTTTVGSGLADTSGSFSVTTSTLAVGSHSFTATATGAITSGSLAYTVLAPQTTPTPTPTPGCGDNLRGDRHDGADNGDEDQLRRDGLDFRHGRDGDHPRGARHGECDDHKSKTPPASAQCKDGDWRSFGIFKNQGDCVSFFATGGKNPPATPHPTKTEEPRPTPTKTEEPRPTRTEEPTPTTRTSEPRPTRTPEPRRTSRRDQIETDDR